MRSLFSRQADYGFWDQIGTFLSFLCLIHCVLTPFVVLSLPILARYYLANPLIHLALALAIVPVGLWSFYRGYSHHASTKPLVLGIPGIFLVSATPYLVHVQGFDLPESGLVIIGSIFLIIAHRINRRSCQKCAHH